MQDHTSSYDQVCLYVGRLFLESQREIERLSRDLAASASLRENLLAEQRKVVALEEQVRQLLGGG